MSLSALVVPLRSFDTAKTRLSETLSTDDRSRLARVSAERVLDRGTECHRVVVCDCDSVQAWSDELGIDSVRVVGRGLNAALTEAVPVLRRRYPSSTLIIAHGDIVDPTGLDALVNSEIASLESNVVIVPDRHRDGTNVLCLDPLSLETWTFEYGRNSFDKHLDQARRLGLRVAIHEDRGLATDIDTLEDLTDPLVRSFLATHLPEWTPHERTI